MEFPPVGDIERIHTFFGSSSAVILDDQMETYLIKYSWPDNDNNVIPASWLRIERTLENCMFIVRMFELEIACTPFSFPVSY